MVKQNFGDKILDQGHPQVELLTKMFGRISRKWQSQMAENGRREAIAGIGRSVGLSVGRSGIAVVTMERLADREQPNIDYRS